MNATSKLHALGQRLWLDNITRELLDNGTLQRYCSEFSVSGLTSNPTIFEQAIRNTSAYDEAILHKADAGQAGEALFFDLALADLRRAAALFLPIHASSDGADGWVSLEVSPLIADDAAATVSEAKRLYALAQCANLLIKIPGTPSGVQAIEETIFAGVPVNVTLLFSREHYIAAADAYWRGIRRRIAAGLDPRVNCVASLFISRWDQALTGKLPPALNNRAGLAIAGQTYAAYRARQASTEGRWLAEAGARPQRLLWASTGTKDPLLPASYYVEALAAPDTIDTVPEKTLLAFAAQGAPQNLMPEDGGDAEIVLSAIARAGVDRIALAARLQREGAQAFSRSWTGLLTVIASKSQRPDG